MFEDRSKETDKCPLHNYLYFFFFSEQKMLSCMHNTQPSGLPYIIFYVAGHPIL